MPKLLYLMAFVLCNNIGWSQFTLGNQSAQGNRNGLMGDLKGNPVQYNAYKDVTNGSAFLFEDYRKAVLTSGDGTGYPPLMVKIDLVTGKIFYLDPSGNQMELISPVMYIKMSDILLGDNLELLRSTYFSNYEKEGLKSWLQLYVSGKAMLLKPMERTVQRIAPYGTATAAVSIEQKGGWVIAIDKDALLVKKYKDAAEFLTNAKPEIKNFKPTQKKLDAQLEELARYYNSL